MLETCELSPCSTFVSWVLACRVLGFLIVETLRYKFPLVRSLKVGPLKVGSLQV